MAEWNVETALNHHAGCSIYDDGACTCGFQAHRTEPERSPLAPGEGTWSVFAEKMMAERDAARAELEVAKAFHDVAVKERDRNLFTARTIGADLAEIGRLCGIKDDEYPLKAVKRVVNERNEAQFERMETGRALMEMLDERDELLHALIRVTMWEPRSTEAACQQDYDFAASVLKKHGVKREKP